MGKKYEVFVTRACRYDGERVEPGTKLTIDETEMPGMMSSGRVSLDEDDVPEAPPAPAKPAAK
jgi:hypothetical protein